MSAAMRRIWGIRSNNIINKNSFQNNDDNNNYDNNDNNNDDDTHDNHNNQKSMLITMLRIIITMLPS